MIVRSHLKYFQSPLFSVFVMCIERGCWLRMHSTQYTINKVSRTNVFYALFAKKKQNIIGCILKILYLLNKYQDLPSCYQHEKTTMDRPIAVT